MRGQRHAPAVFTPRKDPVPIVQEAGWAPEPVWTGAENLVPIGIRSPDLPARSQSLHRLRYTAHTHYVGLFTIVINFSYYNLRSYIFCKAIRDYVSFEQTQVAVRSKVWVYGSPLARIAGLNPVGTWTSVSFECSVLVN